MFPPILVEFFSFSVFPGAWLEYPIMMLPLASEPVVLAFNLTLPLTEPPFN